MKEEMRDSVKTSFKRPERSQRSRQGLCEMKGPHRAMGKACSFHVRTIAWTKSFPGFHFISDVPVQTCSTLGRVFLIIHVESRQGAMSEEEAFEIAPGVHLADAGESVQV